MKKFGGYIFIFLTIVNMLAPISATIGKNHIPTLTPSIAQAKDYKSEQDVVDDCAAGGKLYCITIAPEAASPDSKNVSMTVHVKLYTTESWLSSEVVSMALSIKDKTTGSSIFRQSFNTGIFNGDIKSNAYNPYGGFAKGSAISSSDQSKNYGTYSLDLLIDSKLNPNTEYVISIDSIRKVNQTVLLASLGVASAIAIVAASTAFNTLLANIAATGIGAFATVFCIPVWGQILMVVTIVAATVAFIVMTESETNTSHFETTIKTPAIGASPVVGKTQVIQSVNGIMPGCALWPNDDGNPLGCLAQAFYYAIFVPTSFLFAMGGKFFDWFFNYSIQDSSYRTGFVVEGWRIVRDVCNIFFIFVILLAAVKLILGIGSHTKDTIVHVVIIGLLINFSLFATQIIIDSSNILARVFYNSHAIKVSTVGDQKERGGLSTNTLYGDSNELPLSAAIVNKVDPQKIITEAARVNIQAKLDDTGLSGTASTGLTAPETSQNTGIGPGAFFLVTFLSTCVNLLGFFVFITISLAFVGRVIGLWFAMVFVPFAFFSYTMPGMLDNVAIFGWKNWWKETLQMAFLAPVFMFFMYLILLFVDKGFADIFKPDSHGVEFILQTIIPFIFIGGLLLYAKKVATDMSGTLAGNATKVLNGLGQLTLAGAAGGAAAGGRQIGTLMSRSASGATATQQYDAARRAAKLGDNTLMNKYNEKYKDSFIKRNLGKAGAAIRLQNILGKQELDDKGKETGNGIKGGIGGKLKKSQKNIGEIEHGVHELEEIYKKLGITPGTKFSNLSPSQVDAVNKKFKEANEEKIVSGIQKGNYKAKYKDAIGEDEYKKDPEILEKATKEYTNTRNKNIQKDYMVKNKISDELKLSPDDKKLIELAQGADLTSKDKSAISANLSNKYKEEVVKKQTTHILDHEREHMVEASKTKISTSERLTKQAAEGSWDIRNISGLLAKKQDSIGTKSLFGISSTLASGMRMGLKNFGNIDPGTSQKDLVKDLKNAFTDAIKNTKLKVEIPHAAKHDDHGHGGHDDHGHGGGGH